MSKSNHLIDFDAVIQLEWGWLSDIEYLDCAVTNLDLARWHVLVTRSIGALTNRAGYAHHIFGTKVSSPIDHTLN
jgi:hypothetical protein